MILVPKLRHSNIPTVKLYPKANPSLRKIIVSAHNYFRSNVNPPASDMLKMVRILIKHIVFL